MANLDAKLRQSKEALIGVGDIDGLLRTSAENWGNLQYKNEKYAEIGEPFDPVKEKEKQ